MGLGGYQVPITTKPLLDEVWHKFLVTLSNF